MPVYEYECTGCKKMFTHFEPFKNEEYTNIQCTACGGTIRKLISKCTFRLKGDSWARDGYSKKGGK
jgi:putative FmdB family regulatory protein